MSVRISKEELVRNVVRLRHAERLPTALDEISAVREDLERSVGPTIPRAMAARLLGVSQTALDGWIVKGDIPAVIAPSGRREVPRAVVVDLLETMQNDDVKTERNPLAATLRRRRLEITPLDPRALLPASYLHGARPDGHRRAELIALAYHRALAERLNEQIVSAAKRRLAEWRAEGKIDPRYADKWEHLLECPPSHIAEVIKRDDQRSRDLRQNSPLSGSLPEPERRQILEMVG